MKSHDTVFAFRPRLLFSQIILYDCADVAFAPYGEYWRQIKKICVLELLSTARVQSFRHIREEEVFNLVDWTASNVGSAINLTNRIQSTTYSIISRAAFGEKSEYHDEFISLVGEASEVYGSFCLADLFPSFKFPDVINRARPNLEKIKQRAERILEIIIKKHKEEMQETKTRKNLDLVDVLLKFHCNSDHLGFFLTSDNVKAVIWVSIIIFCRINS